MIVGGAMALDDGKGAGHLVLSVSSIARSLGSLALLLPAMVVKADAERMLALHAYEPELRAARARAQSGRARQRRPAPAPLQ